MLIVADPSDPPKQLTALMEATVAFSGFAGPLMVTFAVLDHPLLSNTVRV